MPNHEKFSANSEHAKIRFVHKHTIPTVVRGLEPLKLLLASEVAPLWSATERQLEAWGVSPPFWAFCWAGGLGLARFLRQHPELVEGKRVCDLAAGSGVVAIVAAQAGAKSVVAVDIDPLSAIACQANARLNNVSVQSLVADVVCWDAEAFTGFDVLLAGDVFYDRTISESFCRLLRGQVSQGRSVYAADPKRAYRPTGADVVRLHTDVVEPMGDVEAGKTMEVEILSFLSRG